MAVEKASLRVTELDFISIRENLKQYLRSQKEFQDFDFEGSGMSVLLDILAYNTHYMGYYVNMVGNEMFLDTAQLRSSILSHAKNINYVPGSKEGAFSKISFKVTPPAGDTTNILTVEKYTKLLGADKDGVNYPFVCINANTVTKANGTFMFNNVFIKQGEVITRQYLMDASNLQRRFELPSLNVDTTSVTITVQESSSNTDTVQYSLAEDITTITSNSTVFFLEENENERYTFYFGDDVIGKKPKNGNIISATYLDTVGTVSNNVSSFSFANSIGGFSNIVFTQAASSYGGSDKETVEQVRFRAPNFYTTQNRAVTKNDYETLLIKDYNYIESVSVWGGEENDPVVYGKVYAAIKTKGNYALTNFEKEQIKNDLIKKRSVLTVTPEIVDPDYTYINLKGKVYYNQNLTRLTSGEINQLVRAAISDYVTDELNLFDSTFRKSRLQYYIENAEKSITGSDLTVFVQKRFRADTTNVKTYNIRYNMPLQHPSHFDRLYSFPEFKVFDSNGVARDVYIEELPEAQTGIDSISTVNAGRGYQSAPTVTITGDGSGATAKAEILAGRIINITVVNAGTNYSLSQVIISGGNPIEAASATATLQANVGILRLFYYGTNGRKVVVNNNVGSINYLTGEVVLNSLRIPSVTENDAYDLNFITLNNESGIEVINPLRNRIITLDENDPRSISIDIIAE